MKDCDWTAQKEREGLKIVLLGGYEDSLVQVDKVYVTKRSRHGSSDTGLFVRSDEVTKLTERIRKLEEDRGRLLEQVAHLNKRHEEVVDGTEAAGFKALYEHAMEVKQEADARWWDLIEQRNKEISKMWDIVSSKERELQLSLARQAELHKSNQDLIKRLKELTELRNGPE